MNKLVELAPAKAAALANAYPRMDADTRAAVRTLYFIRQADGTLLSRITGRVIPDRLILAEETIYAELKEAARK